MSTISVSHKGDFSKTFRFFDKLRAKKYLKILNKYGQLGVDVLSAATPRDSGRTAESWGYTFEQTAHSVSIIWTNSNNNHGVYIAVLIQYGHGTRNGGYVQGIDYINPAMKPVFEEIANAAWLEVIADE